MGGVDGLPWRDGGGQIAAAVIVSDAELLHRVPQSDTSSKQNPDTSSKQNLPPPPPGGATA